MTDLASKIKYISLIFTPTVILLGLVGNTLSFIIMMRKKNRSQNTCFSLAVVALVDNAQMITLICNWIHGILNSKDDYSCKLIIYFVDLFMETSTYFIIIMTIDRTITVCFPLKKYGHNTKKLSVILGVVFLVLVIRNVPFYIFGFSTVDKSTGAIICVVYNQTLSTPLVKVLPWFDICFQTLLPFVILLTCNSIIIHKLRLRAKQVASLALGQVTNILVSQNSVTMMLLFVSFAVLILTLPFNILVLFGPLVKSGKIDPDTFSITFWIMFNLYYANNAINFYLCLLGSRGFRKDMKNLICRKHQITLVQSITSGNIGNTSNIGGFNTGITNGL